MNRRAILMALRGAVRGGAQSAERMPRKFGGSTAQMASRPRVSVAPNEFEAPMAAKAPAAPAARTRSVVDAEFDAPATMNISSIGKRLREVKGNFAQYRDYLADEGFSARSFKELQAEIDSPEKLSKAQSALDRYIEDYDTSYRFKTI